MNWRIRPVADRHAAGKRTPIRRPESRGKQILSRKMDRESLQSANRRYLTFLQTLTAPLVEVLKKLLADKTMSVAKAVQGVHKAGYQSTSRRFGGSQETPTGSDVLQDADLRQTLASQGCCSRGRPAGR